jgi:hypothetical protein
MVPTAQASVAERAATACKAPPGAAAAGPRTHLQLVPSHRSIRAPRPVVPTAQALDAVAGTTPVKRNRFVQLSGGTRSVNRALEAKARALAGLKGYPDHGGVRDRCLPPAVGHPEGVPDVETRLQARPVYHRKRDSIEAHLTIVFAALAVSHWIETTTGWSIKKFVRTARRYRTITIQAGSRTITAADPVPNDLQAALTKINNTSPGAH